MTCSGQPSPAMTTGAQCNLIINLKLKLTLEHVTRCRYLKYRWWSIDSSFVEVDMMHSAGCVLWALLLLWWWCLLRASDKWGGSLCRNRGDTVTDESVHIHIVVWQRAEHRVSQWAAVLRVTWGVVVDEWVSPSMWYPDPDTWWISPVWGAWLQPCSSQCTPACSPPKQPVHLQKSLKLTGSHDAAAYLWIYPQYPVQDYMTTTNRMWTRVRIKVQDKRTFRRARRSIGRSADCPCAPVGTNMAVSGRCPFTRNGGGKGK